MILWISDDLAHADLLLASLQQAGHTTAAMTPQQALTDWANVYPDLIVIDTYTADMHEVNPASQLRTETVAPIILLTPTTAESHLIDAYQAGISEVVVKPIGPALLLAKIQAWLRHTGTVKVQSLLAVEIGGWRLDPVRRTVSKPDGKRTRLTQLEFRLLHYLMLRPDCELTTEEITAAVYGYAGETSLLKHLVYRLRRKLEPDTVQPRYIQTVPGGYVFTP